MIEHIMKTYPGVFFCNSGSQNGPLPIYSRPFSYRLSLRFQETSNAIPGKNLVFCLLRIDYEAEILFAKFSWLVASAISL